ncbi:MAG: metallophosphoesterase [Clostridia bacterium]|nr:metallophosphoesterase [Clostridia bacterium]
MEKPTLFVHQPTVYVYHREYQIMIPFSEPALVWVRVGEECYYDHFAGVMRTDCTVHRVCIPQAVLDEAKEYTVCYRRMPERIPYFPESDDTVETTYSFHPIPKGTARFYHLSDVHNGIDLAIEAASHMEHYDGLILNGDIPNHSGELEYLVEMFRLSGTLSQGEIPCIFTRGNHDTRGAYGEHFGNYCPHRDGKTYFTFQVGDIWGICLDCGEDKDDTCDAYGYTAAYHPFRLEQTRFIKDVIARADEEYNAPGVKHKFVICHAPFSHVSAPPFDIEQEIYTEWCKLIGEHIQPELFIAGHTHKVGLFLEGGELDQLGQFCPVVVGGKPLKKASLALAGTAYTITEKEIHCVINEADGKIIDEFTIPVGDAQ